jgi:uncharacterized Zn-binding protein involved in type VI secretion
LGDPLFHVGAQAICPHGGQVSTISSSLRVRVGGQPVATIGDTYLVAGCAFTVSPTTPQPCEEVEWLVSATRVMVDGKPAILRSSSGLCLSAEQIPQGAPLVVTTQMRVVGT